MNACWCSCAQCFPSQKVSVNGELEKNEQLFINDSRLSVCIFALFVFPLPQSVQVLRTRRASSCQDRGGVGQRDQGLVSERIPVWYGRVFWFTFALCGRKRKEADSFFLCFALMPEWSQRLVYVKYRIKHSVGEKLLRLYPCRCGSLKWERRKGNWWWHSHCAAFLKKTHFIQLKQFILAKTKGGFFSSTIYFETLYCGALPCFLCYSSLYLKPPNLLADGIKFESIIICQPGQLCKLKSWK